jgi:predicted negative regulator of RcsB-dependent stress response
MATIMPATFTTIHKIIMAYDLEEQEQLATFKAWWNQYGNLTTWVLIAALVAFSGWSGYKYYQRDQSAKAVLLYEEIVKAVDGKDAAKVARATADIKDKFSRTAYAQMGALAAAKSTFDTGDLKSAKAHLQWVADNGRTAEFKAIARVRLAGVLLDEKSYDEGLRQLAGDFPEQFAGLVADRRGDLLFAQNKLADARTAYQTALEKTDVKNPARQLIQLKLDALGGAAANAA